MGSIAQSRTIRAARLHGHKDMRVDDIPTPDVGPGQLIVDVEWCGICGSDLHEYLGPFNVPQSALPMTQGHEICGKVHDPPPESKFKDGDEVMVDPRVLCHKCTSCKQGKGHVCHTFGYIGGSTTYGGYGEKVVVEEDFLLKLPPQIPLEYAAVIEPLAVVWHAIKVSGVNEWKGKSVLVIGGGPIGFALLLCLRAVGADTVIVSEPTEVRRKQVAEFVKLVVDPVKEDVEQKCKELVGVDGVEIVFDCAGVPQGLESAFKAVRYEGLYIMVAVWEKPMVVPNWQFLLKHITMKGTLIMDNGDFAEVMQMMTDGKLQGYEKMVTGRIRLNDIVKKGFEELINNKDAHIKILVDPKPDS